MKPFIIIAAVWIAACSPKPQAYNPELNRSTTCFKGKLVKRGICGQRVIQLLSDPSNTIAMAKDWTDSLANRQYQNVFTVANPCDFPATIREGEEFTFALTTNPGANCITCFAYTPVPREKNNIKTGCTQ